MKPILDNAVYLMDSPRQIAPIVTFYFPTTLSTAGKRHAIGLLMKYTQPWRCIQETRESVSYELGYEVSDYATDIIASMLTNAWEWLLREKVPENLWLSQAISPHKGAALRLAGVVESIYAIPRRPDLGDIQ